MREEGRKTKREAGMVAGTCRKGVKEGRMGEWQEDREGGRQRK